MKEFAVRHPLMVGGLAAGILYLLGAVLGPLCSYYYYLIFIPAIVIWVGGLVFSENWRWVCTKCSQEASGARKKYCFKCGGVMKLIKKEKLRSCPNGHYVDEWDKFCPKCSAPLEKSQN